MKCNPLTPKLSHNYPKIGKLSTLKPIATTKMKILNIPSQLELLLLSANLNYQGKLIMDGEAKKTGDLKVIECIDKSLEVMAIVDDYENKYITYAELKKIKKDFGLNRLYLT